MELLSKLKAPESRSLRINPLYVSVLLRNILCNLLHTIFEVLWVLPSYISLANEIVGLVIDRKIRTSTIISDLMNSSTTIRSLPDPKLEWEEERFLLYLIEALISDETHTFG